MALIEHLEKLRHFYKIAQHNSINETAISTGLSQAGLSKSLSLLENELNCKLFIRSREGLALTREGETTLESTEKILNEASHLENRLRSLATASAPKKIHIGMYDSIAVYFGIELQKYLNTIYPNVVMTLVTEESLNLFTKVKSKEVDMAIGVNFHKIKDPELTYYPLFEDHYSFYKASNFDGSHQKLAYLVHERAADESGTTTLSLLKKNLKSKRVHFIHNFETLKTLTLQGLGIGVLPTLVAKPFLSSGQLMHFYDNQQKHIFGKHSIGFLINNKQLHTFGDFVEDIVRLGNRWIKL